MRAMQPDEDHLDIIRKLDTYLVSDENNSIDILNVSNNLIKEFDTLEKYVNVIPDEKYRNDLNNNISMMRNYLISLIDTITDLNN